MPATFAALTIESNTINRKPTQGAASKAKGAAVAKSRFQEFLRFPAQAAYSKKAKGSVITFSVANNPAPKITIPAMAKVRVRSRQNRARQYMAHRYATPPSRSVRPAIHATASTWAG